MVNDTDVIAMETSTDIVPRSVSNDSTSSDIVPRSVSNDSEISEVIECISAHQISMLFILEKVLFLV